MSDHETAEDRIRAKLERLPDSDAITVDKALVRELLADLDAEREKATWWHEAGESLCWEWYAFQEATTPLTQAQRLIELSNHIFDVSSFLPSYDEKTGQLRDEEAEEGL